MGHTAVNLGVHGALCALFISHIVYVSLSPVKVEKKRKDRTPSPSSTKMIIDLTAEEEYETFPLTQLSEKEPVRELMRRRALYMNVRCTVLVHGPPQQHLPRPQ